MHYKPDALITDGVSCERLPHFGNLLGESPPGRAVAGVGGPDGQAEGIWWTDTCTSSYTRQGIPLSLLADALGTFLQRPVIDQTGLTGHFDVDLRFRPMSALETGAGLDSSEPDLMTAVEEQLGLKLVAGRASLEKSVIDRVERPLPD